MTSPGAVPEALWQDRRVFLTGATGLVGGALARQLIERGAEVVALVRDKVVGCEYYRQGIHRSCTEVRGELEDLPLLTRAVAEYEIDTTFHLAAQTIVGIGVRSPVGTFESNIRGTYNLLEACRRSPTVHAVVVASSDKAYGAHDELPYKETHALLGAHPYDVSKACADMLCRAYHATYGLPAGVARCANFFGPGDLNWNRIIPGTIRSVIRGERPVIRSDGTPVRDYLFMEDGASAYRVLAEQTLLGGAGPGEAFNFGNNTPKTVLEVTNDILRLMKSDLKPEIQGKAKDEIQAQYLDSSKAASKLGWAPAFTFEGGLRETIRWYEDHLRGKSE